MSENKNAAQVSNVVPVSRKAVLFLTGSLILIGGVTLILLWWPYVAGLFKGALGIFLALTGLIVLAMIKD